MDARLLVLASFIICCLAQGQLYLNHDATGDHVVHPWGQAQNIYFSLNAYPCTKASCDAGTCTHPFCATDASGNCLSVRALHNIRGASSKCLFQSGDETWTTTLGPLSFTFACCTGSSFSTCGQPPRAGGFITVTSSFNERAVTASNLHGRLILSLEVQAIVALVALVMQLLQADGTFLRRSTLRQSKANAAPAIRAGPR